MALGVGDSSLGWKISIEDDGFIKIWLTLYLTNREITKKRGEHRHLIFLHIFLHVYNFLGGFYFDPGGP